jgi:putative sigma-54 modulation protein
MLPQIQAQGFVLTEGLRGYIMQRLRYALPYADDHIQRISVRLYDANGPRGGIDKGCRIQIVLKHLGVIVIDNIEPDLYAAIKRAIDRAGWVITRRLARRRVQSISIPGGRNQMVSPELAMQMK